jgi:hypothetical protein
MTTISQIVVSQTTNFRASSTVMTTEYQLRSRPNPLRHLLPLPNFLSTDYHKVIFGEMGRLGDSISTI